jgi:hypothetical protein
MRGRAHQSAGSGCRICCEPLRVPRSPYIIRWCTPHIACIACTVQCKVAAAFRYKYQVTVWAPAPLRAAVPAPSWAATYNWVGLSNCGLFCGEQLQLAYLALLRPHGWESLPNRCLQSTMKTDFGLKCLYWPYFSPYPWNSHNLVKKGKQ